MLAAVTGGSGCIGRALLGRLGRQPAAALFRRADDASTSLAQRGGRVIPGDLDDDAALARLVEGADVVYHCAATMGKSDLATSRRVNVAGTERVARAAARAGVRRFVYVSSISVYSGSRAPANTFTEEMEPQNISSLNHYARTKYQGEQRVREVCGADQMTFTIIRPTNVYGPWSRPWFLQLADAVRWMPFVVGQLPVDVVYVDDVADALVQAAASERAANQVFHIGHEPVLFRDFVAKVGEIVRRRPRPLPDRVDRWVRALVDHGYRLATGKRMSMSLLRPAVYPHALGARVFGYAPRVRLDEGLAITAEWYRQWR